MQVRKLKKIDMMLLHTVLSGNCKTDDPKGAFIYLVAHIVEIRKTVDVSFCGPFKVPSTAYYWLLRYSWCLNY